MSKFCVIGKSLPHTLSPKLHELMGLDYGVVEIPRVSDLRDFFALSEYKGFNVTIPYKEEVLNYLDVISDEAAAVGAVNTVIKHKNDWYGYNTDVKGLEFAFEHAGIELKNRTVLILGSGGTSKTAQYLAHIKGADKVIVVSRTGEVNYQNCSQFTDVQVIINTTPVGMFPNTQSSPIDLKPFKKLEGVFDAIYNPLTTQLVKAARGQGVTAANGLSMLVGQGVLAKDIFTGTQSDKAYVEKVLADFKKVLTNIVLVGMPSSGKTTVAKLLAKELGRSVVDTDSEIEREANKRVSDLFAEQGEDYFRKLESKALASAMERFGHIVATGGGAVLQEQNREIIKDNAFTVWLLRDTASLSTEGRPLSQQGKLEEMFENRKGFYKEVSNISVDNNGDVENTVEEIKNAYEKYFSN